MEKINIAKLLKDCPKGMELDCTLYEDVTLFCASDSGAYPIKIETPDGLVLLDKYGGYSSNNFAKCIIFPKGTTTWEGFVPPCLFKDGDVVVTRTNVNTWISIFKGCYVDEYYTYVDIGVDCECFCCNTSILVDSRNIVKQRLATEDEKQKLFVAIKANGYKWNAETKTLEKLIEQKFDITTLKPFDKVLVRDNDEQMWTTDIFSFYNEKHVYHFMCVGHYTNQCIPYEGNEHLCGTTDDCDDFYKTWE